MNILKHELKQGIKPFLLWTLGIAFLVLGGMIKFKGVAGADSGSMSEMLAAFPKAVLALFGMAEANIETLGGFYAVLQFYIMIAVSCYAISLGTNALLRESFDKTYEFLFTKPCGRTRILALKLTGGLIPLILLCALNMAFSYLAPPLYGIENDISDKMPAFAVAVFVVALLFYALSAFISAAMSKPERAVQLSYAILLASYGISVLFDTDERFEWTRFLTPLKYFRVGELLNGVFAGGYLAATLIMTALFAALTFVIFRKKDLNAA